MLDTLTADTFEPHRGSTFTADLPEDHDPLPLELVEISALAIEGSGGRQQFCLLFRGPAAPILEQQTWNLHHDDLGELPLFLVPVGPGKDEGMQYEAVFT